MSQRADRVGHLLQRELVELLRELKDPRLQEATLITVTHVSVSDDLGVARVLLSVVDPDPPQVVRHVGRAQRFLHAQLMKRLRAKKVPELRFYLDETEERAGRIDRLLREVAAEPPVGESSDHVRTAPTEACPAAPESDAAPASGGASSGPGPAQAPGDVPAAGASAGSGAGARFDGKAGGGAP